MIYTSKQIRAYIDAIPAWHDDKTHPLNDRWNEEALDEACEVLEDAVSTIESLEKTIERHEKDAQEARDALLGFLIWISKVDTCVENAGEQADVEMVKFFAGLRREIEYCAFENNLTIAGYSLARVKNRRKKVKG